MAKALLITLGVIFALGAFWVFGWAIGNYVTADKKSSGGTVKPPGPHTDTSGGPYYNGAVAADAENCSVIGVNILKKNGSAVDAAVAAMLCVGVINMQSTGVAGGGFMMVYDRSTQSTEVVDFRETAPAAANETMFVNRTDDALYGGLGIAVPGEVRGYYTAWKKYGRLPWKDLVEPALNLATEGFHIGKPVYEHAVKMKDRLKKDPGLRELLFEEDGETVKKENSRITNLKYAATLKTIMHDPESFYVGTLARDIIRDMEFVEPKGILTLGDLKNYTVKLRKGLTGTLGTNHVLHMAPPPASGAVMGLLLNILKGYNFTEDALYNKNPNISTLTYHRILEAFRFAFAWRSRLGDPAPDPAHMKQIVDEMLDQATGNYLRHQIWDNQTHENVSYYANFYTNVDHGTSHLTVLAPNGDAVSLTSTINYVFGGKYRSTATGMIYNNEMADFDNPGNKKIAGLQPSAVNFPAPGKRPYSSITPIIITNTNGNVEDIVGASGGKRIITATALAIMNKMWFGQTMKQAVEKPRVHVHLIPDNNVYYETTRPIPPAVRHGLKRLGHHMNASAIYAAVQGITRDSKGVIYGTSDPRKNGKPAGF